MLAGFPFGRGPLHQRLAASREWPHDPDYARPPIGAWPCVTGRTGILRNAPTSAGKAPSRDAQTPTFAAATKPAAGPIWRFLLAQPMPARAAPAARLAPETQVLVPAVPTTSIPARSRMDPSTAVTIRLFFHPISTASSAGPATPNGTATDIHRRRAAKARVRPPTKTSDRLVCTWRSLRMHGTTDCSPRGRPMAGASAAPRSRSGFKRRPGDPYDLCAMYKFEKEHSYLSRTLKPCFSSTVCQSIPRNSRNMRGSNMPHAARNPRVHRSACIPKSRR